MNKSEVEKIKRGLKTYQVSNLAAVDISVEEMHDTFTAIEALAEPNSLFNDRDSIESAKRRLRAMIDAAARCVVLADSTKLGVRTLAPVCGLDELDVLVTDGNATMADLAPIRSRGVDVVIAEMPPSSGSPAPRSADHRSSGS